MLVIVHDLISVLLVLSVLFGALMYLKLSSRPIYYLAGLIITLSLSYLFIVHLISINMGRDGFSIFVKKDLVDDKLYFYTAKLMASQLLSLGHIEKEVIFAFQTSEFGYDSPKSLYFSALAVPLYLIFPEAGTLGFKSLNILFFCIAVLLLARELLDESDNRRQTLAEVNVSWYAFLFAIFISFYPTLLIRLVQIEKDVFLFSLFSIGFICLLHKVNGRGTLFKGICLSLIIVILIFYRPQFSLVLLFSYIYLVLFKTKSFKVFFLQLAVVIVLIPIPLLLLKSYFPDVFTILVAIKSYSVLAGATDVIAVDYESVLGIYKTIGTSLYFYLFAPISIYALKASALWKVMMLEPILFFIIPFLVCLFSYKKVKNGSYLLMLGIVISIILALLSVYYESHVGSYMRKRLPLYAMWIFLGFYFAKHRNKVLKNEKNSSDL